MAAFQWEIPRRGKFAAFRDAVLGKRVVTVSGDTLLGLFPEETALQAKADVFNAVNHMEGDKQLNGLMWLAQFVAEAINLDPEIINLSDAYNLIQALAALNPPLAGYDPDRGYVIKPTAQHHIILPKKELHE